MAIVRYAVTIFLSAFLLFQVQPLIARYILPWFGGGPAVWTTCMLFFQTLLLAGYVLFVMRRGGDEEDQEVVRMLIDQVVTEDQPRLTSPQQAPALPAPEDSDADSDERLLP